MLLLPAVLLPLYRQFYRQYKHLVVLGKLHPLRLLLPELDVAIH
jgi:hypothetical protein